MRGQEPEQGTSDVAADATAPRTGWKFAGVALALAAVGLIWFELPSLHAGPFTETSAILLDYFHDVGVFTGLLAIWALLRGFRTGAYAAIPLLGAVAIAGYYATRPYDFSMHSISVGYTVLALALLAVAIREVASSL